LRGAERRGNLDKNSTAIRKGGKKAEDSLDCFPPRFARARNDGDRLSSQNALAAAEKRRGCHCEERSDVAIQKKILPLSAEATKKRKTVWIASRHASLAVAMTGTGFHHKMLWQAAEKHRGCHCEERSDVAIQKKILPLSTKLVKSGRKSGLLPATLRSRSQ